jgi:hypothetical protein
MKRLAVLFTENWFELGLFAHTAVMAILLGIVLKLSL